MGDRVHFVTLKESEMLLESQDNLQNLALAVLARFMGVRPAADGLWLSNRDVVFAEGDCSRAEITLDSVKTAGRKYPLFSDAVYIVLKLLCDREPDPNGLLIKGRIWDCIRDPHDDADTGSLSLSVQFGRKYRRMRGRDLWQKPFVNTRSTVITELSKFYGYDQHSIGIWLGNTPGVANKHYPTVTEDHFQMAAGGVGQSGDENWGQTGDNFRESVLVNPPLDPQLQLLHTTEQQHRVRLSALLGRAALFTSNSSDLPVDSPYCSSPM